MDILIPDTWLRDYLITKATPRELEKYLSLCGPSVERVTGTGINTVYSIEVTTNRVDSASIYGIAREANAILPKFGIKTTLKKYSSPINIPSANKVNYLTAIVDPKLCYRFSAILIKNVKIAESPKRIKDLLTLSGVRPINNVVDISNFIMAELGQPIHTFDYDKIVGAKMILRESRKGEKVTTLDNKKFVLGGGDIVIEDGSGKLIDLAGIMGGKNSAIDENTKNVLLFVQTYNPVNIRRTSMSLAQRTDAAVLFEKGLDPEAVSLGIVRGIQLFKDLTGGTPEKTLLDIYPDPVKTRSLSLDLDFISNKIGVPITKIEVTSSLTALGFGIKWFGNKLTVTTPSFRANDITIPEDIVEEVARIYGYHNLPNVLMTGSIPPFAPDTTFDFEYKIKTILKGYGGVEVYTYSLVPKNYITGKALRLINPLGEDTEYLRTSFMPSLVAATRENSGEKNKYHLFELTNEYLPKTKDLPEERLTLAGVFSGYNFRNAKGIVAALLAELNINVTFVIEDAEFFKPNQRVIINSGKTTIGEFGVLETDNLFYYEFSVRGLKNTCKGKSYIPIPKYPAQIEDLTIILPQQTKIGEVINTMTLIDKRIASVSLKDIFKDAFTFQISYQDLGKTLTNEEVEVLRNKVMATVKTKFGGNIKG